MRQGLWASRIQFNPVKLELFHRMSHFKKSFGFKIEIEIDQNVEIRSGSFSECDKLISDGIHDLPIGIQFRELLPKPLKYPSDGEVRVTGRPSTGHG